MVRGEDTMAKHVGNSLELEGARQWRDSPMSTEEDGANDLGSNDGGASPAKVTFQILPDESDPTANSTSTAVPSAVTMSNSSSSAILSKDSATTAASPYGTRSRNRSGGSRPNYAEDREMELDFEAQAPLGGEDSNRARQIDVQTGTTSVSSSSGTASRRIASAQIDAIPPAPSTVKDSIPGTSTFSANPGTTASTVPPQPSKKRKLAAQSTNLNPPAQISTHVSSNSSQTSTRGSSGNMAVSANFRGSSMLSFENCRSRLKDGKLVADDGTVLKVDDHVYLVCEPPGEPYYLGRIMEFLHIDNDTSAAVDALRMNWYYRPKDIGRKTSDHRQVFASMHSDISPLTALRGICQIKHKSQVKNFDEFRKMQDCFWYEKLYDRYIHRYYEVIPTSQVVNVPANVKRVLDDRWRFILVESGRGKELTSAVKSCKRCSGYCASNNSVDCGVCHQTYHMNCINPPLLKKPSRGFAWSCGPCSRAQERKLEARNTPNLNDVGDGEDEEQGDDEDEDVGTNSGDGADTGSTSPVASLDVITSVHPGTPEQIHQASLWPFRYLGVHCKVEDALDYDDRIYPRASSRLGPRHQAEVIPWPGRPFILAKPIDIKRKYVKGGGHKKDAKLSKETLAAIEADKLEREKRPKWIVDEPTGYIPRGEDFDNDDPRNTAQALYKPPEMASPGATDPKATYRLIDEYMFRAREFAEPIGVRYYFANFLDKAINILYRNNFDVEISLEELSKVEKKDLKEPELTPIEQKRFEDGVTKYGSEWHSIKKHVKSASAATIVRYYYIWKKSDRGKQVWGNYSGRKGKKEAKKAEITTGKLQDDVADAQDDSAFDNDKIAAKKREFQCKFCFTRTSPQWRRAPNTATGATVPSDTGNKAAGKDKAFQPMVALCLLCAVIWRKYGVQRDDADDHKKNLASKSKRKFDESFKEFQLNDLNYTTHNTEVATTPTVGTPIPQTMSLPLVQEPVRKKPKSSEKDHIDKKLAEKAPLPPVPEIPKAKLLPCAICLQMEPLGDQHISCKECRMTVHRNCYGVVGESRGINKWICDMCFNDRTPQISVQYKCMLCPIEYTEQDFVEPPKMSHKKKTEKEREKDRVEREIAEKNAEYFRKKQADMNRPLNPREPLKRTANNNWVHVTCAVWTPEVKFGNAKALEPSEGIPSIASSRYGEVCALCNLQVGACVTCHCCHTTVHVECAHQHGYILGFDITPVKGSRRDQVKIVDINGEAGTMTALIWCKDHVPTKTIVHRMYDVVDKTGLNALQLYVQNFKQADLTLSGTVRKANLINQSTKVASTPATLATSNRRTSTTTVASTGRGSISNIKLEDSAGNGSTVDPIASAVKASGKCITCGVDTTPKWWPYPPSSGHITSPAEASEKQTIRSESDVRGQDTGHPLSNGYALPTTTSVALAAAALSEDSVVSDILSADVQCHKCHFKRLRKVVASPPPATAQPTSIPSNIVAPSTGQAAPLVNSPPLQTTNRFAWSRPSPYSPPRTFNHWGQSSSVPSPSISAVNHYGNGTQSPRATSSGHSILGQPSVQQAPVNLPQSPHVNGLNHPAINGYSHSPHRTLAGGVQPTQNGSPYLSYNVTRLPPQHLTNGGPPPRAPENPFPHATHTPIHSHSPYGHSHMSPSLARDTPPPNRDIPGRGGTRPTDGRVNGGASASPSLQNLLS